MVISMVTMKRRDGSETETACLEKKKEEKKLFSFEDWEGEEFDNRCFIWVGLARALVWFVAVAVAKMGHRIGYR